MSQIRAAEQLEWARKRAERYFRPTPVFNGKNANGQPVSMGSNYGGGFGSDYSNGDYSRSAYQNWLTNLTNWNIG